MPVVSIGGNQGSYNRDNGFYSAPTTRAGGVATALWTLTT
ncbi:hypothetical protein LCGC14_2660700, partial [marine sediment metagenome]